MEFRKIFDTIPDKFDKYRPRYSAALFDDLIAYADIGAARRCWSWDPERGRRQVRF